MLKRAGCIDFCRSYQYQEKIGRVGYGKTNYACLLPVTEDYTLIPREIFQWKLSYGAFCVCLCLLQQAGNNKKAFPSIRSIAKLLEMGCSTVCRAFLTGSITEESNPSADTAPCPPRRCRG